MAKRQFKRRQAVIEALAVIMKRAEPTAFAAEGPARHGVRRALCLAGWTWQDADDEAAEVTRNALARAGARRPTWAEGQLEYTKENEGPRTREQCKRCAKPLPEGHYTFCGPVCAMAAKVDRNRQRDREELVIAERAARAAWTERQPEQTCPCCERAFRPKHRGATYCSNACRLDARRLPGRSLRLVCEPLRDDAD
ncbi:hypothetical protein AMST5_01925 [freshwater sediment metagenome]|uniref:Uncharacterized protein n=1 Tax=freshwater sediment metagenome TaxID=556182 RepID=A0AA48LZ53_9ZZZZ